MKTTIQQYRAGLITFKEMESILLVQGYKIVEFRPVVATLQNAKTGDYAHCYY